MSFELPRDKHPDGKDECRPGWMKPLQPGWVICEHCGGVDRTEPEPTHARVYEVP